MGRSHSHTMNQRNGKNPNRPWAMANHYYILYYNNYLPAPTKLIRIFSLKNLGWTIITIFNNSLKNFKLKINF